MRDGLTAVRFGARPGAEPPRTILVVMLSALGDAVMVLPVVSALRRTFPAARISWVLQQGPYELVRGHPAVDDLVLFHRGRRGTDPGALLDGAEGLWDAVRELRGLARRGAEARFDLLLDLQVYFKAGLLTGLTPATVKLGFDAARARDLNTLFTTHRIPPHPAGSGHVQDQYFEFLRHLGVDPHPVEYGLTLTAEEERARAEYFGGLDRPACAVVLATSDPRKNWTPEGYARVLAEMERSLGLRPLLVGGRSAEEERMAAAVLERLPRGHGVKDARGQDLRRLLWLLEGSALVLSPDTGPLHLARAVDTPVVGLYGITNPKRTGPYGRFTELVVDGYARSPGEAYPTERKRRPGGMGRVTPEKVMEKIELALSLYPPGAPA